MKDKPAYNISKHKEEADRLETMNGDTVDTGEVDCAENRYNFNSVMLRTRFGLSEGLPRKTSALVAKAFNKMKRYIESKTDPGDKEKYRVQQFSCDPGTEFQGAMAEQLGQQKVLIRIGEVDRHTDQAVVENRNGKLEEMASCMAATAMGENMELYCPAVGLATVRDSRSHQTQIGQDYMQ